VFADKEHCTQKPENCPQKVNGNSRPANLVNDREALPPREKKIRERERKLEGCRDGFQFIEENRSSFPAKKMCHVLKISRSGILPLAEGTVVITADRNKAEKRG